MTDYISITMLLILMIVMRLAPDYHGFIDYIKAGKVDCKILYRTNESTKTSGTQLKLTTGSYVILWHHYYVEYCINDVKYHDILKARSVYLNRGQTIEVRYDKATNKIVSRHNYFKFIASLKEILFMTLMISACIAVTLALEAYGIQGNILKFLR